MTEELNALEDTTWDIVPSPPDIHPVGCKWVIMLNSSTLEPGQIYRRLILLGS